MFDLCKYYSSIRQIEAKLSGQSPIYLEILWISIIGSLGPLCLYIAYP